jgi:hypothetical protein
MTHQQGVLVNSRFPCIWGGADAVWPLERETVANKRLGCTHLAENLARNKNNVAHGLRRRTFLFGTHRIEKLYKEFQRPKTWLVLHQREMPDTNRQMRRADAMAT